MLSLCRPADGGCLLWPTKPNKVTGYAWTTYLGRRVMAHRAVFQAMHGPISSAVFVCHRCDVPNCVNPDHLFGADHATNMADMKAKGRASKCCDPNKGTGNPNAKVDEATVREVRRRVESGERPFRVAQDMGLHKHHVSVIARRLIWRHVD